MNTKISLTCRAKVYITNVCNLTCDQCNRYNNFNFKGWQSWKDYADQYKQWGKLIEFTEHLTILGGEPLLNPDIVDWIHGLSKAFDVQLQVRSNGLRLNQVKGLYDALLTACPSNGKKNYIAMSLHNKDDFTNIRKNILAFLQGKVQQTHSNGQLTFTDENDIRVIIQMTDDFVPSGIQNPSPGRYTLHNSDPIEAHKVCEFARWKSYQFSEGKMHKCAPAHLRPEFDLQNPLDISDEDRELLNSYQPLTLDNFNDYHEDFLAKINDPIPQCKFCANHNTRIKIFPIHKGLKKQLAI